MTKVIISLKEVMKITGRRTTFIYDRIKKGEFPRQVKMGSRSGWIESEVVEWVEQRIRERDSMHW